MGLKDLLIFTLLLATTYSQSLNDPWLRDPLLVGLWKLTRAINSFGWNLFKDLVIATEENVLICPYSISTSFGILYHGSKGDTEKELDKVLGYAAVNLTKDEAAQIFYLLSTKHLKSSNPKLYLFDAPSTILVNRHNGVLPRFRRGVEVLFQAPITVASFIESEEELTQSVNEWIAARTRNRIPHILEFVNPFSDMTVLNAAYFRGVWMHKFPRPDTHYDIFYDYGSSPKEVQMMRLTNILNYHEDSNHSLLELPFKGRNVSMIIILPKEFEGIEHLHSKFSPEFFEEETMKMTASNVHVILPKFRIKFGADLAESMEVLGAETLFRPDKVDLSGMIRRDSISFGEVRHETALSVTENGVEVVVTSKATSSADQYFPDLAMPSFHVDHPFLFVIYERRMKMVLLIGRVMEL